MKLWTVKQLSHMDDLEPYLNELSERGDTVFSVDLLNWPTVVSYGEGEKPSTKSHKKK